jgi:Superinfection immunity protein
MKGEHKMPYLDGWTLLMLILFFYFLPTMVAASPGHRNISAIFVLNLFLGWTFVGWVAALMWAVIRTKPAPAVSPPQPAFKWQM